MIDPNQILERGGPNGPQFRQQQPLDPGMAPPQVSQQIQQGVNAQSGMAAQNSLRFPFYFKFTSSLDGTVYEGQFTAKKLSIRDITLMGVRKVQLNGGYHYNEDRPGQGIEEHIDSMNSMIAHLELALIQWPIWFNMDQIYDPELLSRLYMKVAEFENNFFRKRGEAGLGRGVPINSSPAGEGSSIAGRVEELGGKQVQPTLDP